MKDEGRWRMADRCPGGAWFIPHLHPSSFILSTCSPTSIADCSTAFGPQHWWPGDTRFEMIVGAMLTPKHKLEERGASDPQPPRSRPVGARALYDVPLEELEELIRPAGYFRVKARRLRSLLEFLVDRYGGRWMRCFRLRLGQLRGAVCSMSTALDPRRPTRFCSTRAGCPVSSSDAYTHRVLPGTGWIGFDADYHQIQDYIQGELPQDVPMYNEFHALLVRLGKDLCRKTNPKCVECPLCKLLPRGGPLEPE